MPDGHLAGGSHTVACVVVAYGQYLESAIESEAMNVE